MKRILRRVLGTLLALLIATVALVSMLVGTQAGVSFLARGAQTLFPGLFAYDAVEGHLLDRLELRGLQLKLETAEIAVHHLVLDWAPTRLLRRQLRIHDIALEGVTYQALAPPAPPPPPSDQPLELPAVSLPLDVHLERLKVAEVKAYTAPDTEPLIVDSIELAADWISDALELHRLEAALPGISVQAEGDLIPADAYALTLHSRIGLEREDLPRLQLTGGAAGDLRQLRLDQVLTGDVGAQLQARIDDPLERLRWQLDLQQIQLPVQQFIDTLPAQLSGQLQGKGDLQTAHVVGDLALRGDQDHAFDLDAGLDVAAQLEELGFRINELKLRRADSPLRFDLSGEVDKDLNLDLTGDWAALQWPLDGAPTVASDAGTLELKGSTEAYRLNAEFALGGKEIPPGQWTLAGQGDAQRFQIEGLQGRLLEGELTASGEVHWAPQVGWDLALATRQINPGAQYPGWPGRIDLSTAVTGHLEDQGPRASVQLRALQGELRGYALGGEGNIDYAPDSIELDGLILRSGAARIAADGALGAASDLGWEIDVPDLSSLLPDAKGRIAGAGKLTGPRLKPRVQADLSAADVSFAGAGVERLTANADYDLSETSSGRLVLEGSNLNVAGQQIPRLLLEGSGVGHDHQITLEVQHETVEGRLRLVGGYDGELWSGQLSDLGLQSEEFGAWRQAQPSTLSAGADGANLEQLCLTSEAAAVCAAGNWSPDAGSEGAFELKSLPLAWLEPLLPTQLASATGELSAQGTVSQDDELTADVSAKLSPGEMVFVNAADELRVPHSGGDLKARIDKGALDAAAELAITGNEFALDVRSPNLLAVDDIQEAAMSGNLRIKGPNFDYLPAFVPAIETIDGTLDADLELAGTVAEPVLAGKGQVALKRLVIPQAGLDLQDTKVDLDVLDNVARVSGRIRSGGEIELTGDVDLNRSGFPIDAAIKGQDFVAVNLPEMRVLVSPDLTFASAEQGMALTGDLEIPEAEILIRDIPQGAVTTSEDIVVASADGDEHAPRQSPTRLDVNVVLGQAVHVAAMGLDAFLEGGLKVTAEPGEDIVASGEIRIVEGTYRAYNQDLTIERGVISYAGGTIDDPGIDVRATRDIDEVVVGVNAYGSAKKPKVTTFSTPAMAPRDVISYLITGKPTNAGAKLSLGRQINDKLSVQVGTDTSTGESEFTTRYRINRKIHLEATSTPGSSAGDVFYNLELD